jgi:hypothetical protein
MIMFLVTITMGNEAMQTPEDVASALRTVANKLESGTLDGSVKDVNGNTVGQFSFSEE